MDGWREVLDRKIQLVHELEALYLALESDTATVDDVVPIREMILQREETLVKLMIEGDI